VAAPTCSVFVVEAVTISLSAIAVLLKIISAKEDPRRQGQPPTRGVAASSGRSSQQRLPAFSEPLTGLTLPDTDRHRPKPKRQHRSGYARRPCGAPPTNSFEKNCSPAPGARAEARSENSFTCPAARCQDPPSSRCRSREGCRGSTRSACLLPNLASASRRAADLVWVRHIWISFTQRWRGLAATKKFGRPFLKCRLRSR
jgi:hypothetical protein